MIKKFIILAILLLSACSDNHTIVQSPLEEPLSFSGTYLIGSQRLNWPRSDASGMIVFNVVRNMTDKDWYGTPRGAAYDETTLKKVGEGVGVLTEHVWKDTFVPKAPHRDSIPANSELESLIYVPVNFNEHPRVFVYWQFVAEGTEFSFPDSVSNAIEFEEE